MKSCLADDRHAVVLFTVRATGRNDATLLRLSDKRPLGGADFYGASQLQAEGVRVHDLFKVRHAAEVEKLEGVEGYRFEFVGDTIHEHLSEFKASGSECSGPVSECQVPLPCCRYVLHALARKGSSNLLCTVTTRAAGTC